MLCKLKPTSLPLFSSLFLKHSSILLPSRWLLVSLLVPIPILWPIVLLLVPIPIFSMLFYSKLLEFTKLTSIWISETFPIPRLTISTSLEIFSSSLSFSLQFFLHVALLMTPSKSKFDEPLCFSLLANQSSSNKKWSKTTPKSSTCFLT